MTPNHLPPVAQAPLPDLHVNMSNALTRAAHSLTLSEKRVVSACIAQCDSVPYVQLQREGAWTVRLTAKDYADAFSLDMNTAYEQLKAAADSLFNRHIRIERQTRKGVQEDKFRWVGKATYHPGEGWVELHWWKDVVPHLFGLRAEFVSYKLKHAAALRSVYSWRLFECLKSWNGTGRYAPTIDDFARTMEVPESYMGNFKYIRQRIIEPAVKELQEKNGMEIEWEAKRAGRKVVALEFRFTKGRQQRLELGGN